MAISLFSGIGGLDLAFEWAGFVVTHQVEKNDYCRRVLHHHYPTATQIEDVHHAGAHNLPRAADVLFGGAPCQPYSIAGKRQGEADDRHLWPEMARIIRETRPRAVLFENVANAINMVLPLVLSDLESAGYTTLPPLVIPALAVGAPHKRDRLFVVAYAGSQRRREPAFSSPTSDEQWNDSACQRGGAAVISTPGASREAVGVPHSFTLQAQRQIWQQSTPARHRPQQSQGANHRARFGDGNQSRMGTHADGLSRWVAQHRPHEHQWPAGQGAAQFDFEPPRTIPQVTQDWEEAVRAIGNAVVPQVVYPIALAIKDLLNELHEESVNTA